MFRIPNSKCKQKAVNNSSYTSYTAQFDEQRMYVGLEEEFNMLIFLKLYYLVRLVADVACSY